MTGQRDFTVNRAPAVVRFDTANKCVIGTLVAAAYLMYLLARY